MGKLDFRCRKTTNVKKGDTGKGERQKWSRHIEFILVLLGNTVGLGNILRFPYMCMRNGGGAFLVAYTFAVVVLAIPLYYLELVIGQFSGLNAVHLFGHVIPLLKGIGISMFISNLTSSMPYGQIVTWVWYYLGMSFSGVLPWTTCDNAWNTENCFIKLGNSSNITVTINATNDYIGSNGTSVNLTTLQSKGTMSPGEEFLQYNVLELTNDITDFGGLRWQLVICHFATWGIACACFVKGIHSYGKAAYVMATAPYVFLTILLIRGSLLPGSRIGIDYYLKPNWSSLLDFKIWTEAAIQVFYSAGTFGGSIITLASFNDFHNNCFRDSVTLVVINCLTSLYGGFAVFSVLGHMSHETGVPVDKVMTSGPGLAFVLYPEALSKLPVPQLWSVIFFVTLAALGYGTMLGQTTTVLSSLEDGFPRLFRRRRMWLLLGYFIVNAFGGLLFCTRSGMYWYQLIEWYVVFTLVVSAIFGTLGLAWIYGMRRIFNDIELMNGVRPYFVYKIFWGFISPVYILICFLYSTTGLSKPNYGDYQYPGWAFAIACLLPVICIVQIPLFAIVVMSKTKGTILQRLKILTTPTERWGPQDKEYRNSYRKVNGITREGESVELEDIVT